MTDQVQRWSRHGYGGMITERDGEYVTFTDYDQLRAERDALREALERILEEDDPAVMDGIALNALAATQPSTQGDRDDIPA